MQNYFEFGIIGRKGKNLIEFTYPALTKEPKHLIQSYYTSIHEKMVLMGSVISFIQLNYKDIISKCME